MLVKTKEIRPMEVTDYRCVMSRSGFDAISVEEDEPIEGYYEALVFSFSWRPWHLGGLAHVSSWQLYSMHKLAALLAVLVLVLVSTTSASRADVKLPRMLGDHMVMQRDVEVPLWGTADAGRDITITLDGKVVALAKSGSDGSWSAKLPPTPAGGPHAVTIEQADGKPARIGDVLFGEVWVCSGQSNMEMPVSAAAGATEAIAAADRPLLRLLVEPHRGLLAALHPRNGPRVQGAMSDKRLADWNQAAARAKADSKPAARQALLC
jgi:hypothetical protein